MSLRTGFLARGGIMLGDLAVTFGLGPLTYTPEPVPPLPPIVVTLLRGPHELVGDSRNYWAAILLAKEVLEVKPSEKVLVSGSENNEPEILAKASLLSQPADKPKMKSSSKQPEEVTVRKRGARKKKKPDPE